MSNQKSIERKTAAIMFTDIAGYTETMSQNEQKALASKKANDIKSLIDNHNNLLKRLVMALSLFLVQDLALSKRSYPKVRVGIHIGDIVFENNDVYGDGVNIAARLESLAPAGGVLISRNVYDELINKDGFDGVSISIGRLVEVYACSGCTY